MTTSSKPALFEHKNKPLLSWPQFFRRQLKFILYATMLIAISLSIGMIGYHSIAELNWVNSFHNATMILAGMGEIDDMPNDSARIFSGMYALFSGVVFVSTIAVMFAPLGHRFLHMMHLEAEDQG